MQWNLIRLRKETGYTQQEIADKIGISVSSYHRKEKGQYSFRDTEMFILKDIFGKSMDDIFLPTDCNNIAISEKGGVVNGTR